METRRYIVCEAKKILKEYRENLKPFLKSEVLYVPADVKTVATYMNYATYYNIYLGRIKKLSDQEEQIKVQLRHTMQEVIELLENQEDELRQTIKEKGNILEIEFED